MGVLKRFGVSLEDTVLARLDTLVRRQQFPNRSQALRALITGAAVTGQWKDNKTVAGCVVLVYDHHRRELLTKSVAIQHHYQGFILAAQHVHLDHDNCLEVISLKGPALKLRELADRLIALKGVAHGQLVMTCLGGEK